MKVLYIFSLLFLTTMTYTAAQRCAGVPRNSICTGERNVGTRGRRCRARNLWYYDPVSRQCLQLRYLGCRGNNNRWCSKATCEQRCRPRVLT